jgi:hypothetical protein
MTTLPSIDDRIGEIDRLADRIEYMTVSDRVAAIDNVLYFLAHCRVSETPLDYELIAHSRVLAAADPDDVVALKRELHELVRKSMITGTPSSP